MTGEVIAIAITSAVAAFAGVVKAINGFNDKLQRRFNKLQDEIDRVEDNMLRDYVMKQDLIREMNSVNQKLDKIWEFLNAYLISQKSRR
jgi:ABC-type phosphate transport system auxiliary subunit